MKQIVVFTFKSDKSNGSQIIRDVLMVVHPIDSAKAVAYGQSICEHQEDWFFEIVDVPASVK